MSQKFFLFKRKDPSISGGTVFSDNGKGISVISFPARNLAYMAANRGNITMYFNDSAPFEENSLTLAGESFEKTSVTVSCDTGEEADLMEEIINFINRDATKNIMKFDATGVENTFGAKTSKPTIDARVRARPVERGLVGTESTITGLDADALVGATGAINTQIDFIRAENKPAYDIGGEQISVSEGSSVTSGISNRGIGTTGAGITYSDVICKEDPTVCKTKTFGFDSANTLTTQDLVANGTSLSYLSGTPPLNVSAEESDTTNTIVVRDGSQVTNDVVIPRFELTTDGSGNITVFDVTYGGGDLQVGDEIRAYFSDSNVFINFTITDEIGRGSTSSFVGINFGITAALYPVNTPLQPWSAHTAYMVVVRPNGALLNPIYANNITPTSSTATFTPCMGPFPFNSKEDELNINYNSEKSYTNPIYSSIFRPTESFSKFIRKGSDVETPENNMIVLVVRRDNANNLYVYDKYGELIATKEASIQTSGDLFFSKVGLVLPADLSQPQLRIARFGIVAKDIGDLACRNIATQLYDKYKA